jgi:hypothetical protein
MREQRDRKEKPLAAEWAEAVDGAEARLPGEEEEDGMAGSADEEGAWRQAVADAEERLSGDEFEGGGGGEGDEGEGWQGTSDHRETGQGGVPEHIRDEQLSLLQSLLEQQQQLLQDLATAARSEQLRLLQALLEQPQQLLEDIATAAARNEKKSSPGTPLEKPAARSGCGNGGPGEEASADGLNRTGSEADSEKKKMRMSSGYPLAWTRVYRAPRYTKAQGAPHSLTVYMSPPPDMGPAVGHIPPGAVFFVTGLVQARQYLPFGESFTPDYCDPHHDAGQELCVKTSALVVHGALDSMGGAVGGYIESLEDSSAAQVDANAELEEFIILGMKEEEEAVAGGSSLLLIEGMPRPAAAVHFGLPCSSSVKEMGSGGIRPADCVGQLFRGELVIVDEVREVTATSTVPSEKGSGPNRSRSSVWVHAVAPKACWFSAQEFGGPLLAENRGAPCAGGVGLLGQVLGDTAFRPYPLQP